MSWAYLLLIAAILNSGCISEKKESSQPLMGHELNNSLLHIARQEPEVTTFIAENTTYEITVLAPQNITQLSKRYPVIYGNLPDKTLYKIDFKGERGMLVIVDLENKKVLRYFRTAGVNLG